MIERENFERSCFISEEMVWMHLRSFSSLFPLEIDRSIACWWIIIVRLQGICCTYRLCSLFNSLCIRNDTMYILYGFVIKFPAKSVVRTRKSYCQLSCHFSWAVTSKFYVHTTITMRHTHVGREREGKRVRLLQFSISELAVALCWCTSENNKKIRTTKK